jgi:6-phosphogluconolactonase
MEFLFFDWIWLGLGNDGHTASIFPGIPADKENIAYLTMHPESKQLRITLSEKLINNSKENLFIVLRKGKEEILEKVLVQQDQNLPASRIEGKVRWFISE